jgi:RecA-family ATPase
VHSIDVVVLDPISELATFDENSNDNVNKFSKAMARLKTTIIFSHHIAKPPYDTTKGYDALSLNNARGAKAVGDRIDSALMVWPTISR